MAAIDLALTDEQRALKAGVTEICKRYPGEYWRDLDSRREYPEKFVNELTQAGYLGCLIPPEYGGAGLGMREGGADPRDHPRQRRQRRRPATPRCTSWAPCCGTAARRRSRRYLPKIATGELRLQAFGVTEPDAGSDTHASSRPRPSARATATSSTAGRCSSRARMQSDLMLLLARTTPAEQVKRRTDGLSVFLIDIRGAQGPGDPAARA